MLLVSTGFKTAILGPNSFTGIFNGGSIRIFGGSRPSSANRAETSAPIGVVIPANSPSTSGLTFTQVGQYIVKPIGVLWQLYTLNPGTPTWFRLIASGDTFGDSQTFSRIDGDVGVANSNADMWLANLNFTPNVTFNFDSFLFSIPPLGGL